VYGWGRRLVIVIEKAMPSARTEVCVVENVCMGVVDGDGRVVRGGAIPW
jgi:hypothetical protein